MYKKLSFIIVLLSFSFLNAKEYQISLKEAIQIALSNNQKMKISQVNIEIAEAMYKQALSANYPSLNYNLQATRLDEAPTFKMRGSFDLDNSGNIVLYNNIAQGLNLAGEVASANVFSNVAANLPQTTTIPFSVDAQIAGRDTVMNQLELTLPLYTGGKIDALVKQAKLGTKIASKTKTKTLDEIVYDVKRYYYGVLLTQKLKKLSYDTLEELKYIEQLSSNLYQGGSLRVKKTDYLRSKLSVSMLKSFYESILEQEALAKAALSFAMGLSWEDSISITQTSFTKPTMDAKLKKLIQNAYKYNPELNTLQLAIDLQKAKLQESKSEYYPQIGLFGSTQNIYNDYEYGIINDTTKNSWSVGVGITLNLFNGQRTESKIAQNKLEEKKLLQQEFLLKEGLALQLKSSFLKMNSNYKRFKILDDAIAIAKENKELNSRAYQEDMVTTKDVIEAQIYESLTIADYYRNLHEFSLSQATIDFVVSSAVQNNLKR